jgi:hypothetical protein
MNKAKGNSGDGKIEDLLRNLLITSLAVAGVKGEEVRRIVGCDMNRVTRIVKHIQRRGR